MPFYKSSVIYVCVLGISLECSSYVLLIVLFVSGYMETEIKKK